MEFTRNHCERNLLIAYREAKQGARPERDVIEGLEHILWHLPNLEEGPDYRKCSGVYNAKSIALIVKHIKLPAGVRERLISYLIRQKLISWRPHVWTPKGPAEVVRLPVKWNGEPLGQTGEGGGS